ncbi:MAG: 23S rRNA (guanosine(2251)-2'-O)-methyltransferase RlmB [Omnitrophica bacterium RBG_13_46_9]|nr:MAG: 23S rRNA (guanosine(2251)-2'-O)-methyltransferase RlmB [Omnitrophica bacterium RBG_13_46_9]
MVKAVKSMHLYGRVSVFERLKTNPASVKKVLLQENITLSDIERLTRENGVFLERLPSEQLKRIKPAKDLQGVIAKVDKFKYIPFDDLMESAQDKKISLIFLDRINDPQNLGAIIRTAACFGGFAIVIPQFNACGVTEAVLHVASGGENHVSISMVANLSSSIIKAKRCGFWVAGAHAADDATDVYKTSFSFPLGLVLGSEGEGIRYGVQKQLDLKVRIPMMGARLSFNVGIACAIFCYEISRQKNAFL